MAAKRDINIRGIHMKVYEKSIVVGSDTMYFRDEIHQDQIEALSNIIKKAIIHGKQKKVDQFQMFKRQLLEVK